VATLPAHPNPCCCLPLHTLLLVCLMEWWYSTVPGVCVLLLPLSG
jgi:hypothetical protein